MEHHSTHSRSCLHTHTHVRLVYNRWRRFAAPLRELDAELFGRTNKQKRKEKKKPGLAGRPGARGSAVMSTFDRVYSCGASMTSTKPVCSSVDRPRMKHHRTHPRSCLHTHTYDWCIIDDIDQAWMHTRRVGRRGSALHWQSARART